MAKFIFERIPSGRGLNSIVMAWPTFEVTATTEPEARGKLADISPAETSDGNPVEWIFSLRRVEVD